MRLFAGVELDERVRLACAEAARELDERLHRARSGLNVRWIPENNLHVTLWFFGEVSEGRATEITDRLHLAWQIPAFELTLSGIGVFPHSGPIRIVWFGVAGGADEMAAMHRELTARLVPLGFAAERRAYHPHVTLGRAKESAGSARRARAVPGAWRRPGRQLRDQAHHALPKSSLAPRRAVPAAAASTIKGLNRC